MARTSNSYLSLFICNLSFVIRPKIVNQVAKDLRLGRIETQGRKKRAVRAKEQRSPKPSLCPSVPLRLRVSVVRTRWVRGMAAYLHSLDEGSPGTGSSPGRGRC